MAAQLNRFPIRFISFSYFSRCFAKSFLGQQNHTERYRDRTTTTNVQGLTHLPQTCFIPSKFFLEMRDLDSVLFRNENLDCKERNNPFQPSSSKKHDTFSIRLELKTDAQLRNVSITHNRRLGYFSNIW